MTLDIPFRSLSLKEADNRKVEEQEQEQEQYEQVYVERLTDEELVDYARYGEIEILRELMTLQLSSRLLATDSRGNTMLHMFAANGHLDCLSCILRGLEEEATKRSFLDQQNGEGNTALHWACISGQLPAVQLLMLGGAKVALENKAGRTPICEAHKHRRTEILAFFEGLLGRKDHRGEELEPGEEDMDRVEK